QQEGAFAERADPSLDLAVKFGVCRRRSLRGLKAGWRHVAVIFDGKAELTEDAADARGAQRVRPHQGSGLRGPDLDGNPEQGDAPLYSFGFGHQRLPTKFVGWAKRKRAHRQPERFG